MKKSTVFTFGAAILSLTLLTACGNKGEDNQANKAPESTVKVAKEGFPIIKEKLELSMFAPGNAKSTYDKMAMMTSYANQTGLSFSYTTPPASDLQTKLNLAFASGDLADVIFGSQITRTSELEYGGNALLALEDYIDGGYAPNLKKILDAHPDVRKSITTPDGHIYSLPSLGYKYNMEDKDFAKKPQLSKGSLWYNGEWLEKLNMKEPKTADEFYDMLVKFRDTDLNGNGKKDEIPLSTSSADTDKLQSLRPWMLNAFGIHTQDVQVDENGKVSYGAEDENYRAYLEFMEKLYSEKLLDQEVFSQSDDQKKAKGSKNQLGAYVDWFSFFTSNKSQTDAQKDPMAYPLSSKESPKAFMDVTDGIQTGAFSVSSNCASPEAAIRWVDYFYSDEGSRFLNIGPDESEGGYWHNEKNDKGEEVKVYNKGIDVDKSEEMRESVTPDYGQIVPKVLSESVVIVADKNDPIERDAFGKWVDGQSKEKVGPYEKVGFPTLYLSKEEQDKLGKTLKTDLISYVQQMEAKFITGKEKLNDESWNKYQETLKKIGSEKYVEVMQDAYDNWDKSK